MAGKASFWLDAPKTADAVVSGVPGKVVGAGENGTIRVEVGEPGNVVNVPSGGGVFKPGSDVRVQVDASGAPSGVLDAGSSVVQDGLVYAGAEGQEVRKTGATAKAAWEKAERAMHELEEARGQTAQDLQSLRSTLQGAQGDVQRARLMFSSSEKDPRSYFRDLNAEPPLGAVYEQRGVDGFVEYRFRWDGRNWVQFALTTSSIHVESDMWTRVLQVAGDATITGNLLAGGSITADKVVASKELTAKVAKFEESVVSKLRAERAVISGDLIADTLTGKTIESGRLTVKTSGVRGSHLLQLVPTVDSGEPVIAFSTLEKGRYENKVVMGVRGMDVFSGVPGERPLSMTWLDIGAAPYFRFSSGSTYLSIQKGTTLRVPLSADTSSRGKAIRLVNNVHLVAPRAGRYKLTGWAAIHTNTWDTVVKAQLLRGDATEAKWGDLYGNAISPYGELATPMFSGLVDARAGEKFALGISSNGNGSVVRDVRFEMEFVCPL
nr:MAG TPA: hypothetical protein [Caudoviricetes sp.]